MVLMLLKIGEFAALGHVSVRMLRHYDKLELLVPAHVDEESGFRYYTLDQLQTLHRIQDWQALGIPLRQIREWLSIDGVDDLHRQLREQQQRLDEQIQRQQYQLKAVQLRMATLEQDDEMPAIQFVTRALSPQTVISRRARLGCGGDTIQQGFQRMQRLFEEHHIRARKLVGIKHYTFDSTPDFEWAAQLPDMNFQRLRIDDYWELTAHELPAVFVASAVIRGSYRQALPECNGFLEWAAFHQVELAGPAQEIYLRVVDGDIHHPDNLMEVQFPIRPAT